MTKQDRQHAVNAAIGSARLGGLTVSPRVIALAQEYVEGKITAKELRAKAVEMVKVSYV